MSDDNPFAEPEETEKTVLRPNPGGRRVQAADSTAAPRSRADPSPLPADPSAAAAISKGGLNPLIAAASVLLGLASRIRGTASQRDVEGLRDRVVRELKSFESKATATGLPRDQLRAAHYALCATIDDLVLSTPWGSQSSWAKRSMVSTFHNEVVGGERFYEILSHINKNPGSSGDVLELMYVCMALGFEGRLRVTGRGTSEHSRVRDGVFRTLRDRRGEFERELSPHWRGLAAAHRPLTSYIPAWVIGAVTAALLMLMYMGFTYALNSDAGVLPSDLQPAGAVALARPEPVAPVIEPPVIVPNIFVKFLEPEIKEGLVTVDENAQRILVRVSGEGMFASGSDKLDPEFVPLMERIGEALESQPGTAVIVGHTDNVPIKKSLRFPSNFHLSVARAETVKAIVAAHLTDSARVTSEGKGETEPFADNKTAEGRRKNRRIELIVLKPEEAETDLQLGTITQ